MNGCFYNARVDVKNTPRHGIPRPWPHRAAAGQALVLVLVAMLVLGLGLIVLFNTGVVVTRKVRLVNTADAAAYSAAVQQARAFNLIAYMNRASVANEIAMAQMVSWYSWTNFAISATDHMKDALQVIAIVTDWIGIGEAIQAGVEALQEAKGGLEVGRDAEQELFNAGASMIAVLDGTYAQASRLIGDTGAVDAANLARRVVTLNDSKAAIPTIGDLLLGKDVIAAKNYVVHYQIPSGALPPGEVQGAERLRNVVMEARDPFSRQREGSFLFGWLQKYGGTDLVGYHSWVGLDTLDIHFSCPVFICGMTGFPSHLVHFDVPMAWGGAAGVDQRPGSFAALARQDRNWQAPYQGNDPEYAVMRRYAPYDHALSNGVASDAALGEPAEDGNPWITPLARFPGATVGLPSYDDIATDKATLPYLNGRSAASDGVAALDVGPIFTVVVAQPMRSVPTANNVKGIGGPPDFQAPDKALRDGLTALASAQVYFDRSRSLFPRLFDSRRETGNLFSPYWQARRVDTPCSVRQEIALSYGAPGAPCL